MQKKLIAKISLKIEFKLKIVKEGLNYFINLKKKIKDSSSLNEQ